VAPLEAALVAEIEQAALVHADETSWREAGQALWLWVFVTAQTVLYQIGYRTQEIVANVLSAAFQGTLMTDGYAVYRTYPNRLRCWAHLMRKLVGLSESTHQRVAAIGRQLHAAFSDCRRRSIRPGSRPPHRVRWRANTRQRSRRSGTPWNGIGMIRTRSYVPWSASSCSIGRWSCARCPIPRCR